MPVTTNRSVQLYWESTGSGPAVLLLAGLGMALDGWWATIPVLARWFRVIAFDYRDTGRSSGVTWPYTVAQLADDAVAVLNSAEERRAHVYGVSLGASVAQEVAVRHPGRVHGLVLGASTPGPPCAVPPAPMALTFLARAAAMGAEEAQWAAIPYAHSEAARRRHGARIAQNIARRVSSPIHPVSHLRQAAAIAAHSAYRRAPGIVAPTLVVHGVQDVIVPPANGRMLAGRIPGAQLMLWPDAGHLYSIDEPRADQHIARHLLSLSTVRPSTQLPAA